MKRALLWVGIAVVFLVLASPGLVSAATKNNFVIESFNAKYYLSRDDDGRSTLKTVETITANFLSRNQNHGLERAIPTKYDDHSTGMSIASVANERGEDLPYHTVSGDTGDLTILRIGDADTYVYGLQTYVITYTQRDVTKHFPESSRDEFYWDLNGSDWKVPIKDFKASLYVDDGLRSSLNITQQYCYTGAYGATDRCSITNEDGVLTVSIESLVPGQAVTVAIGFNGNTFQPYEPTLLERILAIAIVVWIGVQAIAVVVAVTLCIIAGRRWNRVHNRTKEIGTIVPEYLPPKEYSVLVSAQLQNKTNQDVTAFLLDMAVRHIIVIRQKGEASVFKRAKYEIEIISDTESLRAEEKKMLSVFFSSLAIGERYTLGAKRDTGTMYAATLLARSKADPIVNGLREVNEEQKRWFSKMWKIVLVCSILLLSPVLFFVMIVIAALAATLKPLTEEGIRLRRYLLGLRMYISVAEVERLRMLQSPEGAQKVGVAVNADDTAQIVKLYERVLPYATLFGLEKEWNRQLGQYYEQIHTQPDWYQGSDMFTAAIFANALSGLSTTTSYSTTASSSSSSSGSSGGGFSGGGGGGGGGGGW